MHSELFTIPVLGLSLKSYGLMLCLGFLSGVWLAMRRAERVRANPDTVLDLSFLCLLFGVGGARIFYVAHYWESQFAMAPNKFLAVINITQGG
ncbi:MAG: prolipoprotein diacylglyceryl transferase family protein, partial [Phycisphaerae bacterium]